QWRWKDELDLLKALTSWVPDGSLPVCRTRLADRYLRWRLIEAALACGRRFQVRWVPAYLPVEAHITFRETRPPPYADVTAVHLAIGDAVDVTVDADAAALVVDMAYLRLTILDGKP